MLWTCVLGVCYGSASDVISTLLHDATAIGCCKYKERLHVKTYYSTVATTMHICWLFAWGWKFESTCKLE